MSTLDEIRAALDWCLGYIEETDSRKRPPEAQPFLNERLIRYAPLASLPADGVIVTPDSLARALHERYEHAKPGPVPHNHPVSQTLLDDAVAILAAIAAEGGPA